MIKKFKQRISLTITSLCFLALSPYVEATTYTLQNKNDSIVGQFMVTNAELKDTLLDIARANGLGYHDIKLINPDLDMWMPGEGQEVVLPLQFVLPDTPKKGLVLNIPEMRLYYYSKKNKGDEMEVTTHPLGVGREGWATPYINTRIIEKKAKPNWYPPESIRAEHEEMGDPLPKIVKAGPDNPLGDYALRLGIPEYLIHGTNKPYGVGMRVSHGCIRLYPEDIESLYQSVKVGTPVNIINQPYKVGELDGVIYLEAHLHLEEDAARYANITEIVKMIIKITEDRRYEINWNLVNEVVGEHKGIPVAIGMHVKELQVVAELTTADLSNKMPTIENDGVELRLDMDISHQTN